MSADFSLTPSTRLVFAGRGQAGALLGAGDDFSRRTGPLERSLRLAAAGEIDEAGLLRFCAGCALEWAPEEVALVAAALEALRPRLAGLDLPLPETVWLVRSDGREEGNSAYTRANAIVLPPDKLVYTPGEMASLLAHELFHVLSRFNPALRDALYALIGFLPCGELILPPPFDRRRLTNPDACRLQHAISVRRGAQTYRAMLVHLLREPLDLSRPFYRQMELGLLAIDPGDRRSGPRLDANGNLLWLELAAVSGFYEQVGRNTDYLHHPEEILAVNFTHLVNATPGLPSPRIPAGIRAILARFSEHHAGGQTF